MFNFETEKELKERFNSNIDYQVPVICYYPDWRTRTNEQTKEKYYAYMPNLIQFFEDIIEKAGGNLYLLGPEDDFVAIQDKFDGFIIPGGRDIDPSIYNQQNLGSKLEGDEIHRYNKVLNIYQTMDKKIPILAICWGFQFLNIAHGGDLIQHLENSDQHFKRRRMYIKEGSWLQKTVGSSMVGNCYHHQGLNKIGEGLIITAVDDHCNEPHALECTNGRWVQAVLWHPESTFCDESFQDRDSQNIKIFQGFVTKALEHKKSKKEQVSQILYILFVLHSIVLFTILINTISMLQFFFIIIQFRAFVLSFFFSFQIILQISNLSQ